MLVCGAEKEDGEAEGLCRVFGEPGCTPGEQGVRGDREEALEVGWWVCVRVGHS